MKVKTKYIEQCDVQVHKQMNMFMINGTYPVDVWVLHYFLMSSIF